MLSLKQHWKKRRRFCWKRNNKSQSCHLPKTGSSSQQSELDTRSESLEKELVKKTNYFKELEDMIVAKEFRIFELENVKDEVDNVVPQSDFVTENTGRGADC